MHTSGVTMVMVSSSGAGSAGLISLVDLVFGIKILQNVINGNVPVQTKILSRRRRATAVCCAFYACVGSSFKCIYCGLAALGGFGWLCFFGIARILFILCLPVQAASQSSLTLKCLISLSIREFSMRTQWQVIYPPS
jgi:hypothetical protein